MGSVEDTLIHGAVGYQEGIDGSVIYVITKQKVRAARHLAHSDDELYA